MKTGSLDLFDRITAADVIPLTNTVRLIRYHGRGENDANDNDTDDGSIHDDNQRYDARRLVVHIKRNTAIYERMKIQ